ncbi:MAG TPA: M48 family metalloprotease [Thermoanaerobaculia bacterium]|jgi:predicted Zn-dependent protease|nr:M48 family metalloprotease [Thermoanaerobaculia bacterium]
MRKASLLLTIVLLAACSTNPATGKREFNIVSESQEISIGQSSHQQIIQQFGVYDEKPELTRMVERVGRSIAAASERPNLPWTFTVLDSPIVNAMALPGGYIYITRGMLERINSEDELAGVLGHEVAHVTARHSAQQISRSQLAQLGMVLGAVIAGPEALQQYGQLAELGIGLLFQRYSRAHETQADLLGTGYMAAARYNPVGSERMLMTLQRLDKSPSGGLDRYFMSHPDPAKRVRDVRQKITEMGGMMSAAGTPPPQPDRQAYVRLLEGAVTGNSTEHMVIRNGTIYDRGHGLVINAPRGWQASAEPGTLFAMRPSGTNAQSYFVAQEVDARELQGRDVQNAVRIRLEQMGLKYVGSREARMGSGERFAVDVWQGQTQGGVVGVETTQFAHGDHAAVFMFVSPSISRTGSPLGEVLSQMRVDRAAVSRVDPPRMRIGTVRSGESWSELARRATGNAGDAEVVANINGFDLQTAPPAGMTVKLPEEVVRD